MMSSTVVAALLLFVLILKIDTSSDLMWSDLHGLHPFLRTKLVHFNDLLFLLFLLLVRSLVLDLQITNSHLLMLRLNGTRWVETREAPTIR